MPRSFWFGPRWLAPCWAALALLLAGCIANPTVDKGQVSTETAAHFGSPLAPIEVGPVVVSGDYAIADWTQGDYGGRALWERMGGRWSLVLCSGDSIRRADNLQRAGVPAFNAGQLADQLARAETAMAPERLARLKRFVGTEQDHEDYLKSLEQGS